MKSITYSIQYRYGTLTLFKKLVSAFKKPPVNCSDMYNEENRPMTKKGRRNRNSDAAWENLWNS
jgi:hypothetical protein